MTKDKEEIEGAEDIDLSPEVIEDDSLYYYDEKAGELVCQFFEKRLVHIKGEWARTPMYLEEWQKELLRKLFGWKRKKDGLRRYRTLYLEIPRKNGKSTLAAGLALFLLFADKESGAEVYSAAADREQAAIVFDVAKSMVEESKQLSQRCQTFRRAITYPKSNSSYKVISADAKTKHGFNAHAIVVDELHAQTDRELVDVLKTSTGARRQPLEIYITTAGHDRNSICWEMHDYAIKVRDGIIQDDTFLAAIYAAEEEDDWTKPETWKKANPCYGISIKEEYLEKECKKAQEIPSYENTFRRLHLNQWTEQDVRWIPITKWDECDQELILEDLKGKRCFGGLDLSSSLDISAFALIFPHPSGDVSVLPFFWIPEDNILERCKKDRVPYDVWVRQGYIQTTPGNVIDYAYIRNKINALKKIYKIESIAVDRWNAIQIVIELEQDGLEMVMTGQGFASLSAPTKEFEKLLVSKKWIHGGNPVLRWMLSNTAAETDAAGNLKPSKKKSQGRIDGIAATVNALARMIATGEEKKSVYKNRGLVSVN